MQNLFNYYDFLNNPFSVTSFISASIILIFGLGTLVRERFSKESYLFFLISISVFIWLFSFSMMYASTDYRVALFWAKAAYLGVPLISPTIYHFTVLVLKLYNSQKKIVIGFWILGIASSALIISTDFVFNSLYQYSWGYYPRYNLSSIFFLTFFFSAMILSLVHYYQQYKKAKPDSIYKARIKEFLIAFSIVYIGCIDYLAKYGIGVYPVGYISVLIFTLLIARAIWKYHLIDLTPAFASSKILDTMQGGVLVVDTEGTIHLVNKSATDMLQCAENDLINFPILNFIPEESRIWPEKFTKDWSVKNKEIKWVTADNKEIYLSISASMLKDHLSVVGIVYVATDITERKLSEEKIRVQNMELQKKNFELRVQIAERIKAEEAVKEAHDELERRVQERTLELNNINRELKNFAYIVSHDLKAPLRAIGTITDFILLDEYANLTQGGKEQFDLLKNRIKRMHLMIEGILTYSRTGLTGNKKEWINVQELVTEVISFIKINDNINIQLDTNLPEVYAERVSLSQVFQNLISNAIKYMNKPNGEVKVGAFGDKDHYTFYVKDNGPGIDKKYFDKIFQIFQTLNTRDNVESTGIGLTIVKKIVEVNGGRIWLESCVGEGSCFYFTIPAMKATMAA